MGTWVLTDKNGKKYNVTADTPEKAYDAFNQMQGGPQVPTGAEEPVRPPIPGATGNEPWPGAQQEAYEALQSGTVPGAVPFGLPTEVKRRGDLLPIERTLPVDPTGKINPQATSVAPALPGFIHDIPEQVNTLGSATPGSDESISAMLSLAPFGVHGLKAGMPSPTRMPAKVPSVVQEAINKIERRAATEPGTPKALIVRQEVNSLYNQYGSALSAVEKEGLQKLATDTGGPVRRMVEKTAGYKPTLGVDPNNLKNLVIPGIGASMGAGAPEAMVSGAKAAMAARVAAGVLAKGVVGGARAASKKMANKQVEKLRAVFERKGEGPIDAPRPASPRQGKSQPAPKQSTKPKVEQSTPERPMSVMEEYMREEANQPPPNPSGKIKMTTGAKEPKGTGTDPRFLEQQRKEKAAQRSSRLRKRENLGKAQAPAKEEAPMIRESRGPVSAADKWKPGMPAIVNDPGSKTHGMSGRIFEVGKGMVRLRLPDGSAIQVGKDLLQRIDSSKPTVKDKPKKTPRKGLGSY